VVEKRKRRIPRRQIHDGAVLERMPHCAGHVRLDPKWIAGFARPDTHARQSGDCLAGGALRNHSTGRVLFGSVGARDTLQYKALLAGEVVRRK
jgi:hypothetical protein